MKHILNAVKCLSLLAALLVWSSCTEEMEKGPGKVVEGIPTTVRFAINLPKAEVITTKSLESGTGDDHILNLYLIAFDADGKYETCEQVQKINDEEVLFHVESGEKYIYAIANASNGAFNDITTWITEYVMKKEMNRETFLTHVVNLKDPNVSNISGAGLMVGGFCLEKPSKETEVLDIQPCTINPGKDGVIVNSGAIYLQRMRSEVIFKINGNPNFSLASYEICNVPRQSALFYSANINPRNNKEDYFNIKEYTKPGQNQFSFYMLENTLKPENNANITNVADREKSGNYPTNSTYVVLKGTYKGVSAQPGGGFANVDATVTYYIHLGKGAGQNALNHSDFSTYRNKQYIYNITVTGVSSIIAEVESNDLNDPRAEGDVIIKEGGTILYCDAHYETRVISFNRDEIPTEGLFYTAKTPFGDRDIDWVQFYRNEEGQEVAANYTDVIRNHSSKLMDVDGLLADLNNWSEEEGEVRYYTCFVNEFFYENRTLSTFVNAEDRTLLIGAKGKFQDINIGNSSVLRGKYTFKQRSIKSIFKLDGDNINPWGIETWNETGKLVFGLNDQGGDLKGGVGKDSDNGYNNQIKFLANIENDWEQAINYSFITESINGLEVPEYNLQPNKGMSPYAFTGAMFACMQRNRDENGDGKIDKEEVKWYLPASNQYITLWMGADALKDDATIFDERTRWRSKDNHYYTSTYKNNVYWSEEGITAKGEIPLNKYDLDGVDEWGNDRQYRCVRNLRSNDAVSKIFTVNEELDLLQVRPTNLVDESLRKEPLSIEIDSDKGRLLDTNDSNRPYKGGFEYYPNVTVDIFYDQDGNALNGRVSSWFGFYTNANSYPEKSYCAQYMYKKGHGTGWRMPSQRELALMFMSTSVGGNSAVSRTLHAIVPPNTAGNKRINDGSEYGNLTHTYVWGSGHSLWEAKDTRAKLRCVRDLYKSN